MFGTVLRGYRTTLGLTQEELADRSGLSVRAIRNLEIGRTERPQLQSVTLLASALRLTEPDQAALLAAAGRQRPGRCELPPDVPDLAGRDDTIVDLTRVLTTPGPRLALVTGGPGVGRTALAVHVAHRVRSRFPDGQVFADLADGPLSPDALLTRMLRSLGVTDPPAGRDERTAMLRADLTARRVLVVLDNVTSEAQVRPLLTTGAASAVLVTSRRELVALPGAETVRLDPLTEDAAVAMLARVAGERVHDEPVAAAAVVEACARLPLAVLIAGVWLAARPHRPVADLAPLLADRALDGLAVADLSLRDSIAAHVADLRPQERWLLYQLAHQPPARRDDIDGLVQANLLAPDGTMNHLVRLYARADADTPLLRAAQ
jgi:transcriptional regulator with XRE-family HTH domain